MKPETKITIGRSILLLLIVTGFLLAAGSLISLSYLDGGTKVSKTPVFQKFDTTIKNLQTTRFLNSGFLNRLDSAMNNMWDQYESFKIFKETASRNLKSPGREKFILVGDSLNLICYDGINMLAAERNDFLHAFNRQIREYRNELTNMEVMFRIQESKLPATLLSDFAQRINIYIAQLPYESEISNNFNDLSINFGLFFQTLKVADNNLKSAWGAYTKKPDTLISSSFVLPKLPQQYIIENTILDKNNKPAQPQPDRIGRDWGWVSYVFGWMAVPNNVDFVLLIGMLGFGLFGAGINIYITKNSEEIDASLSKNITLVIVRGFAASIVVFLSMKGGIATLNSGESNPNPLILFLFCFTGAVFSEPIWAWARNKIIAAFPNNNSGDNRGEDSGDHNAGKGNNKAMQTNGNGHDDLLTKKTDLTKTENLNQ